MSYVMAAVWVAVAVLYFNRTRSLVFGPNEASFVVMNMLCGAINLYSAFVVYTIDLTPLSTACPLLTIIYAYRSRKRFVHEKAVSEMGSFDDTPYPSVGP